MTYQQGDTILTQIDTIPDGAKLLKGEKVLHHGATGNHHSLKGNAFGIFQDGERKFVDITEDTDYSHEEHKTISIAPGKYVLSFVQEYDHFNDLARPVID